MSRPKLRRGKYHDKHRKQTRDWRARHPNQTYKKIDGKYKWVPKKERVYT